jgi:hypothetical protein
MEVVLHATEGNYTKLKERFLLDETVNRASMTFKDAAQYGLKGGYVLIVNGTDERCKKALELAKDKVDGNDMELAIEVVGKEKEEILRRIKEEEEKAAEGFGSIFG